MNHLKIIVYILLLCVSYIFALPAHADEQNPPANAETAPEQKGPKLPLPRFVSLRAASVNLRTGPGDRYPIDWVITRKGLPAEITAEHDIWRQIRLSDGTLGWVNQIMLSGKRAALIKDEPAEKSLSHVLLRAAPRADANALAEVQDNAVGAVDKCHDHWCRINFGHYKGWLEQKYLWGVYPNETIN